MNAKEYNIDVTVVCKIKIRTEPQLSECLFPNSMVLALRASLHISDPHEAASVHLLILLKNKTNPKKQNQPLFTLIIKIW